MHVTAPGGTAATEPSAASPADRVVALVPPDILERARRGDVDAFEKIYRLHVGRVYGLCLRLVGDRTHAEEATQEVFVKAWRGLPRFQGRAALSTWLHRLAINVVLDARRSDARRVTWFSPLEGENALPEDAETPAAPLEITMDLERAVAALPPAARMAFVLHDVEGYRHREISEMTGTPEGTWRARLHAARRMLRERLSA
ncbi:MAG: sigma-70 family RNA polymerase sigma factor [bacterium]